MFQSDIDSGFCNGTAKGHQVQGQAKSRTCSPRSPPTTIVKEAEVSSCNGFNKRGSSAMDSGKPPRPVECGAGQSQAGFCFGVSALVINNLFCLIMMQHGRGHSYFYCV
ncbi:Chaperone DnaJ-domain superfamily protein [Zea mays]|uniref:Chaperone DnaJ-domain superfamily protein n=1 Tax=Zea mays TaxID=4577 RepID=A0A1D6QD89_MAIZE|nr:Chaperone DnaJ-domain superfamily protein [Zea mays]